MFLIAVSRSLVFRKKKYCWPFQAEIVYIVKMAGNQLKITLSQVR